MISRKMFALAVATTTALTSLAETPVAGGTLYGARWTTSGSPYILNGTVTIPTGYTLIIDPGVQVRGGTSTAYLDVRGKVTAVGTAAQPIVFTANATTWSGVDLTYADAASAFAFCRFEKAQTALVLNYSSIIITDCQFAQNSGAITLTGASPKIERCQLINNTGTALTGDVASHPRVLNSLFANNEGYFAGALSLSGYSEINHCTVANNKATSTAWYGGAVLTVDSSVKNSVFSGNRNYAGQAKSFYYASGSAYVNLAPSYCLIEEGYSYGDHNVFGAATFKNPTTMAGGILFQPGTANEQAADYALQAGSLGIDSGCNSYATALTNDLVATVRPANGTVDMGCFEYVQAFPGGVPAAIETAIRITSPSEAGRTYQFWYTEDLAAGNWLPLGAALTGTGSTIGVFDTTAGCRARFYRVSQQ